MELVGWECEGWSVWGGSVRGGVWGGSVRGGVSGVGVCGMECGVECK